MTDRDESYYLIKPSDLAEAYVRMAKRAGNPEMSVVSAELLLESAADIRNKKDVERKARVKYAVAAPKTVMSDAERARYERRSRKGRG